MAIDTAEKRRSVAGTCFRYGAPGVTPNATHDQEWRQEAGFSYSGILAPAPPVGVSTNEEIIYYIIDHWHRTRA